MEDQKLEKMFKVESSLTIARLTYGLHLVGDKLCKTPREAREEIMELLPEIFPMRVRRAAMTSPQVAKPAPAKK